MILERLILKNLFSYYGRVEFNLRPPGDERNIVLIHGRNGQGKTSFLNSLKLLVGGVTDELRSTALFGRKFSANQYVIGMEQEWQGIFNTRALREDRCECSVEGVFHHVGRAIRVKRWWKKDSTPGGYQHSCEIFFEDPDSTEKLDASVFLAEQFPKSLIPFYFFDGELIQRLAEDQGRGQSEAIHAILELAPFKILADGLKKVEKNLRSKDETSMLRSRLLEVQGELHKLDGKIELEQSDQNSHRKKMNILDKEVSEAIEQRDELLTRGAERREEEIQADFRRLRRENETLESEVQRALGAGPSAFATVLGAQALKELGQLEESNFDGVRAANDLMDYLITTIPGQVFDNPSQSYPLLPHVSEFYRKRLVDALDSVRPSSPSGILQLTASVRGTLAQQIRSFEAKGVAERVEPLLALAAKRREYNRLVEEEEARGDYRESERELIRELKEKISCGQTQVGELRKSLADGEQALRNMQGKITKYRKESIDLERALAAQAQTSRKRSHITMLRLSTEALVNLCLKSRRAQMEEGINRRLGELLDSNPMIHHVEVKDDFSIQLKGLTGDLVARGSISAGMKQLLALALLWTLNELSQRDILVVIDTPLARLDRSHQEHVLTRYLPKAAAQVIVLPTDSELDEEKYRRVKPFIYRELRLMNLAGDSTTYESESLYK